jgi:GT2 family glycosyltransferase
MKDFFIFSVTRGKKEDTLLYKHNNHQYQIIMIENNTKSLASNYNSAIDFAKRSSVDNIIFCHDDVIIDSNLNTKIPELMSTYDVIGVAGCSELKLEQPCLWHIMGQKAGERKLHGAVAHLNPQGTKFMTSFGEYPHRAVLIDGVFMCVSRKAFMKVKFDTKCPSKFHFYDIDYSLSCYQEKMKVGVGDIMITHNSPGLREFTEDFNKGQEWFLSKWKDNLK